MESFVADVRYALRWLRRSPGFTVTAIASLAIGIGFNSALFTIVDAALFRPLPIDRPDRVVDVYETNPRSDHLYATSSYPDYLDMKAKNAVFTDMIGYSPSLDAVKLGDDSRLALGEVVTGNYFQVLGVGTAIGRTLLPEDDRPGAPRAAVLSYRAWQRNFSGSASALGSTIRIHGQPYSIVGVIDRRYTGMVPMLQPELWTTTAWVDEVEPAGIQSNQPSPGKTRIERRGQRWMFVKGRLKDGETIGRAQANLQLIAGQLATTYPDSNKDWQAHVVAGVHIHPEADRMLRPIALGLGIVVGLVLLIACANVASMLLARASGRQREIGIRLAIGASRRRLIQQLLTESAVLAAAGAAAGIALAWALVRLTDAIRLPLPIPLWFALHIDGRVLVFTIGVSIAAGLVAGLAPALRATRPNVTAELKGDVAGTPAGGRRWTLRDGLVAVQIAVTFVLLVAAGLLTRSIVAAQRIDLGFRPEGLAAVSTELHMIGYDETRAQQFFDRALERIRALPGVTSAALMDRQPLAMNFSRNQLFFPETRGRLRQGGRSSTRPRSRASTSTRWVVRLVEGRNFTTGDTPKTPRVAIVNEAFAHRFFPGGSAIGKRFNLRSADGPAYEIVGIVADYKVNSPGEGATPYVHYDEAQRPDTGEVFLARTRGRRDRAAGRHAARAAGARSERRVHRRPDDGRAGGRHADAGPAVGDGGGAGRRRGDGAGGDRAVRRHRVFSSAADARDRHPHGARRGARHGTGAGAAAGALGRRGRSRGGRAARGWSGPRDRGALYSVSAADPLAWAAALAVLFAASVLANIVPAARAARVAPSAALRME